MLQRNILVGQDGIVVIADFGYTRVLHSEKREGTRPESVIRGYRYLAPEVITRDAAFPPTRKTDTYALAMTILELGTGEKPYRDVENADYLLNSVPQNYRPRKERSLGYLDEKITKELWACLEKMWHSDVRRRPEVSRVREFVERLSEMFREPVSARGIQEAATGTNRSFRSHRN